MPDLPLISCLTVTADRLTLLKEAIACFAAQTYPKRELVIAVPGSDRYYQAIIDHLEHAGARDIRVVYIGPGVSLGAARNLTVDTARGAYVCQWDDDDLYHPERLRIQYEALANAGADACFLTDLLQFYSDDLSLYWLDWSGFGSAGSEKTMLPGSMLVRKDPRLRYPEAGYNSLAGEDNEYRAQVFSRYQCVGLSGYGYLYLYRYHGRNIYGRDHHGRLTGFAMESGFIRGRMHELRRALAALPLPLPYTVRWV